MENIKLTQEQRAKLREAGIDLASTPSRSAQVTKCLRVLGINAELVKGNGYFWFSGPDTEGFYSQSVPVCYLHHLTLEGWLNEWLYLVNDQKNF